MRRFGFGNNRTRWHRRSVSQIRERARRP